MVITKENIGDVVCEYSSGKRFLINNMSDGYIYCLEENGENTCIMAQEDSYGIETDENRIASFHNNVALAQALDAAELAALRRLVPGQYDFREQQEAARVLEIVDDQRTIFLSRLRYERSTTKAGASLARQFLEELDRLGPGTTGVFFGEPVTCMQQGVGFSLCGFQSVKLEEAKGYLADLTLASFHSPISLDVRLASAIDHAGSHCSLPENAVDKSL